MAKSSIAAHFKRELEVYFKNLDFKLGYLKGSKIIEKFPNEHHLYRNWNDNVQAFLSGNYVIKSFRENGGDPNLNVSYNPSTKELTIERIKNGKLTGNLNITLKTSYDFYKENYTVHCDDWDPDLPDAPVD